MAHSQMTYVPPVNWIINASYGNDSIALIQWAYEHGLLLGRVCVIYADTGWASDDWPARVERAEAWVRSLGFEAHRTQSLGFEALTVKKSMFPMLGMQFCTHKLKIEPIMALEEELDPEKRAVVLIGKRRAESRRRRDTQEHVASDPYNGGRALWHPLYAHSDEDRDFLICDAGFEVLPHRSKECWPCINANRGDLQRLAHDGGRIERIEKLEEKLGYTKKGKKKTMFRPRDHKGAQGIRESIIWSIGGDPREKAQDEEDVDCAYGSAGCGT